MSYGFIREDSIQAKDVDSLNRKVISINYGTPNTGDDIDGGNVFKLTRTKLSDVAGVASAPLTGIDNNELWQVVKPATADGLSEMWMAYNPEVKAVTINGKEYTNLSLDIRDYTNNAMRPFDAFKPCKGDLIAVAKYGVTDYTTGTSTHLIAKNAQYKLAGASSLSANTFGMKVIDEVDVEFPSSSVGHELVTLILCEVVAE